MEIVLRMFTYGLLILIIFISLIINEKKRAGYYYNREDKGKTPLVGRTPSDPKGDPKDRGLAYEEPKKGYRLISISLFILLAVVLVIFLLDFFYFNMNY
ncbi:MAG: hypothetical protein ACOX3T_08540 [Bdellovibrionota bacterium]